MCVCKGGEVGASKLRVRCVCSESEYTHTHTCVWGGGEEGGEVPPIKQLSVTYTAAHTHGPSTSTKHTPKPLSPSP